MAFFQAMLLTLSALRCCCFYCLIKQVTRGDTVRALPLDVIIADPRQNIFLQPGDVVTALFQPFSLTVLGATGKNEEINFEGQGITLAQALGRAGGLQDQRARAPAASSSSASRIRRRCPCRPARRRRPMAAFRSSTRSI